MNRSILKSFIFLFSLGKIASIFSYQPYQAEIRVETEKAHVSAANLVDLNRELKTSAIQSLIPFYTPTSAASININLRGIDTKAVFLENSTTLIAVFPKGTQSFTGSTRDESLSLYKDFIKDGAKRSGLLKSYARRSPIDPVAGNPNSLLSQMAQGDYLLGRLTPLAGCCFETQPKRHLFQTGNLVRRAFSHSFDTTCVSFPNRYSYSPYDTWALIVDAPICYNRNGGASSVLGSLGFGLRLPITHSWSLTSIARIGSGGSIDLVTGGSIASIGLTSNYDFAFYKFIISMTNYAGYFTTTNLWLGGVNFNYNLHNFIFKNGLSITSCEGIKICNRPININVSFVDSCFTKDRLYIEHYDEIGVSLITEYINPHLNYDNLSFGFIYQFGQHDYRSYAFNTIYQF